ncbi:MAG TPA: nickel-type superoxide dismutase maturation protease [Acidimicrobiales bacterium]|nr:nickel-type superoxide dismutase maturation protease [Acidimicrobiales bacterium]
MAVLAAAAVALTRLRRVTVSGASMEPGLTDGDRLLVLAGVRTRKGDVVALRDPRQHRRLLIKRVSAVHATGVEVAGDNPAASTDSRQFGPVPEELVLGRAIYRYHPPDRSGRLRRPR